MKYRSIRTKLITSFGLAFSILYALLISIMLFLASKFFTQSAKRNSLSFAKLTFREVSEAYIEYYPTNPLRFSEKIYYIMHSVPNLSKIVIFDSLGKIVFSSTQLFSKGFDNEDLTLPQIFTKKYELTEKLDKEYYVLIPVLNETGYNIHSILYCFSRETENQFKRFVTVFGLFTFILLTLVTMLVHNVLTRQFISNIEALKQIAESVEKGNYSVRSTINSGDELMYLSNTVNAMLESITTYIYNLRAMVEELEARDKARDEILAKISHELRTPLTASKGYVELLLSESMGKLTEEQAKALEIISRNLIRLEEETKKLLQSSKMAIDNIKINLRKVDFEKLFLEVKDNFSTDIRKKKLSLVYDFREREVCADIDQLYSIVENLLSNAVKFTPESGFIEVKTTKVHLEDKSYFKISLFNTSPRIPDSDLTKIFEPFYQVDNGTKREKSGVGLGLYIVKRAVELHKGFVNATNTENGVKFEVYLPSVEACDEENSRDR